MITLATNETNDIFIDASGNIAVASGQAASAQTVRHAVLTNYGELPLDQTAGVPYFNTVFTDAPNLEAFRQEVQRTAEGVEEVRSVSDFVIQIKNGVLRYQMKVTLTDGSEVTVNG